MLKIFILLIATTVVLLFGIGTTHRAEAGLGFDPLHGVIFDDDTLLVEVTIDETITDLRGFTFVFEFDPNTVTVTSVEAGSLLINADCPHFFDWLNDDAVGDSISVDGAGLGCSIDGPGDIVRMRFAGAGIGVSPLRCRTGEMRDSLNQDIPYTCPDGSITFWIVVPVQETSWVAIKDHYR